MYKILVIGLLICLNGCVSANDAKLADVRGNQVTGATASATADNNKGIDATNAKLIDAVDSQLGVFAEKLEQLVKQNQTVSTVVDKVDTLNQKVQSQLIDKVDALHTEIKAGTIHYGGAGWVVLGGALLVLIFLGTGVGVVWMLMRNLSRTKGLLQLVTSAVQSAPPEAQAAVKEQVEAKTTNGSAALKKALNLFLVQHGLFAGGKVPSPTESGNAQTAT